MATFTYTRYLLTPGFAVTGTGTTGTVENGDDTLNLGDYSFTFDTDGAGGAAPVAHFWSNNVDGPFIATYGSSFVAEGSDGNFYLFSVNNAVPAGQVAGFGPGDSYTLVCFLPGTLIATPDGETAVERLAIGDLVTTADGRAVPVRWIGRQTVTQPFGPLENEAPVVIRAGALDEGLPHSDLRVTARHAVILDGLAVNAGALVNGASIARIPRHELGASYTVFHVETEAHDVILANGQPVESFVDHATRRRFDNFAEYVALYGEEARLEEMPLPRAASARQVPQALRTRLAERAATLAGATPQAA